MDKNVKGNLILQQEQSDCGVACLASIVKYYQGDITIEKLRFMSGTSKKGTTLLGLHKAAVSLGFDAEGMEAENIKNLKELKEPAILHVILESKLQHYVIFYGFADVINHNSTKAEQLIIGDPAEGIQYYSEDQLDRIWRTKSLLSLRPNSNFLTSEYIGKRKKEWILGLVKEDIPILTVSLLIGIFIAVLGLSTAIFSQQLIDVILPKGDIGKLVLNISILVVLLMARSGLDYLRGFFILRQGIDLNARIIQKFYGSLLYLPKLFFDTRRTGEFIARMNDTERIQQVISFIMSSIAIDMLVLIVSISFIFTYSSGIGIFSLSMIPLYAWLLYSLNSRIMDSQREVMSSYAKTESNYVDTLQGISTIKACSGELFFEQLNRNIYSVFQEKRFELGKLNIRFNLVSGLITTAFLTAVFGLSSWLVLRKEVQLGEMVALLTLVGGIVPSLNRLVVSNIQIQGARIAFDRMFEFASIQPEFTNQEQDNGEPLVIEKIHLKSVSFGFPGMELLRNISLQIRKGEIVSLLGESGGGKSTLLQLILKFYELEQGEIMINDSTTLTDIPTRIWRNRIGFVPQEVKLFNGTILYNLCLSDRPEVLELLLRFCRTYGFENYFNSFPQGYQTIVGEEGINLSGGQRQLIGIVRGLYVKPELIMIDEGTSAMDRITENFVLEVLSKLKPQMGILMATHKIKIASRADMVYILKNGIMECNGTPLELLKFKNMYSESYREILP